MLEGQERREFGIPGNEEGGGVEQLLVSWFVFCLSRSSGCEGVVCKRAKRRALVYYSLFEPLLYMRTS